MEELDYIEKPKRGHRRSSMWIWCCAGCTAGWILICCSIPLMGMIGMGIVSANEVTKTETKILSIDDVAGAVNLNVTNPVGATRIVSDSGTDEIEVEIVRRANGISESHAREALDDLSVDVQRDGDKFTITVDNSSNQGFPWFTSPTVDLRITVPENKEYDLAIENNVGGMTVRDVNIADRLELTNNIGGIDFSGVVGPQGEYTFSNNVGGINVEVSEDSNFELEATADVGGIDLQLGNDWKQSDHEQESSGESYQGTYGGGDGSATLTLTTNVGGISIHD